MSCARISRPLLIAWLLALAPAGSARADLRQGLDLNFTGSPHVEKPVTVTASRLPLRPPSDRVTICTYNIQHLVDGHEDWVHKTPEEAARQARHAATLIEAIQPDILLIQEIENGRVLKRLNTAMKVPYPLAYITDFGSDMDRDVSQNIALLSRLPLKGLRELDFEGLSGPGRPPRGVLSFFVELGEDHRLLVYGVHLKSNVGERSANYSKRWNALRLIRQDVESLRERFPRYTWEALVTGDMNVDPSSADFGDDPTFQPLIEWADLWLGRPIEERTTIPTREGGEPGRKKYPPQGFDRFLLSPELTRAPWVGSIPRIIKVGINVKDASVKPGVSPDHVSDHYPVLLTITRDRLHP